MSLCELCQKFDVRSLLLQSSDITDEEVGRGVHHPDNEFGFKYHDSILSLISTARNGCRLCTLVWQSCRDEAKSKAARQGEEEPSEEQLAGKYHGQIFLGTGQWEDAEGASPLIIVTAKRPHASSIQLCALDLIARRGKESIFYECLTYSDIWLTGKTDSPLKDRSDLLKLLSQEVFEDSSLPACLARGAEWLNDCLQNHPSCAEKLLQKVPLPTRVIDVGDDLSDPFLYITRGEIGSWAALSYCWGGDSQFALTKGSFGDLQKGRPLQWFPKTLRDAIVITRSLGVKYLWIDALCIFQDSWVDWTTEAAKMGDIYRFALVTIAATASPSVNTGILGPRKQSLAVAIPWRVPQAELIKTMPRTVDTGDKYLDQIIYISRERNLWLDAVKIKESHWATRGWTMQEESLSSRILFYTTRQMTWECSTLRRIEIESHAASGVPMSPMPSTSFYLRMILEKQYGYNRYNDPNIEPQFELDPYIFWYRIVTIYSQRNLSVARDKLSAIAGLAKLVQASLGDSYCAGLWRSNLVMGLLWYSRTDQKEPLAEYLAPSWSWVSMNGGPISWAIGHREDYPNVKELAKVEYVNLELASPNDEFGPLKGGRLTMTAPYHYLASIKQENGQPSTNLQVFVQGFLEEQAYRKSYYIHRGGSTEFSQKHIAHAGQHFAMLQIATHDSYSTTYNGAPSLELLLLESAEDGTITGCNGVNETVYRRIGQVSLRNAVPKYLVFWGEAPCPERPWVESLGDAAWDEVAREEWPLKTVTII